MEMVRDLSIEKWPDRLTRKETCEYLLAQHGIRRQPTTLMKMAWKGGGPKFMKIGGTQVLYAREEVDAWAEAMTSAPVEKASELKTARAV